MSYHGCRFLLFLMALLFFGLDLSASDVIRIADLVKSPSRGEWVALQGRFVARVNYETILFEDETGRIEVIVDEGASPPDRLLDPAYLVRLEGETGSGYLQVPVLYYASVQVVSHDSMRAGALAG